MYPTIVIVLVETQRSMTDICEIGTPNASRLADPVPVASEARATTLGHPSFAVLDISIDNDSAGFPLSGVFQSQDVQERDFKLENHS